MSLFVRLPSIEGLRAFEATARLGSFERAALEINITPSAIGKRVLTLEELLGDPLFSRGGHGLALTASGTEYLTQIGGVLRALNAMPQHHRADNSVNRLRVTVPSAFARQILVPRLQEFTSTHPDLDLEVMISPALLDAAPTDADIEIRNGNVSRGMQLMEDVVVPMAAAGFLASYPRLREPKDLLLAPLLRSPLEHWATWFNAAGLNWPEPNIGPQFVDLGLLMAAAASGQGIALVRPTLIGDWLSLGKLPPIFPLAVVPPNQYYLLPFVNHGPSAEFATWLRGVCEDLSAKATKDLRACFSQMT